jgi:hypothetical protein
VDGFERARGWSGAPVFDQSVLGLRFSRCRSAFTGAEVPRQFKSPTWSSITVVMKNRPGEHARAQLRSAHQTTIRRNLRAWIAIALCAAVIAGIIILEPLPAVVRGYLLGFLTASALATFAWVVFVISGSYGRSMGKLGEEATAETVTSRKRRRMGWKIVHGLYFAGHGDVDHVLVGPGGVFVIESKWTTSKCEVGEHSIRGLMGQEPISQAREGARKVGLLLRHGTEHLDLRVHPVVIIWGPGGITLDNGWVMVDNVLVCEGRRSASWLDELNRSSLTTAEVEACSKALLKQFSKQDTLPVP